MKRTIAFSVLAMSVIACQRIPGPENTSRPEPMTLYFSGEKPATESDGKTFYDPATESILWNETGEKMSFAISNSDETEKQYYDGTGADVPKRVFEYYSLRSDAARVEDGGRHAYFSLTENEYCPFPTATGKYRFHAVYPADAAGQVGNVEVWDWFVTIGTDPMGNGQSPTETSFDPKADVMLAISKNEYSNITSGMEIPMIFERLVTHGKITLKDIPASVGSVTDAMIIAPEGRTMNGMYYINVLSKEVNLNDEGGAKLKNNFVILNYLATDSGEIKKEVKMKGGTKATSSGRPVNPDNTFDLWFCTHPLTINAGETLTVVLYNDNGCISRTINAKPEGIKFEKNKLSTLTISMASATYSDYFFKILMTPGGPELDALELPDNCAQTSFFIKTNAGNYVDCDYSGFTNAKDFYADMEGAYSDENGYFMIPCSITHSANLSSSPVSGSLQLNFVDARRQDWKRRLSSSVSVTQAAGTGSIEVDDLRLSPVELAGLRWYPVNVGFSKANPYGKFFQWGRKAGQLYYTQDNTYKAQLATFDENHKFIGTPDDNTYYFTYYNAETNEDKYDNWFRDDVEIPFTIWPMEEPEEYPGMGNPCPEGWRLPTMEEWKSIESFKTGCYRMENEPHCGVNIDSYMFKFEDASNPSNIQSLELPFCGYMYCYTEEDFKTRTLDFDDRGSFQQYWASDGEWQTGFDYSGNPTIVVKMYYLQEWLSHIRYDSEVDPKQGLPVRCVQDIPGAE